MNPFAWYRDKYRAQQSAHDEILANSRETLKTVRRLEIKLMQHDEALKALQDGIDALDASEQVEETELADLKRQVATLTTQTQAIPADDTAALEAAGTKIAALRARIDALTAPAPPTPPPA